MKTSDSNILRMRPNNYYAGKGYRLLKAGEFCRKSDEYWNGCEWAPMDAESVGCKHRRGECQVRRKI